MPAARRLRAYRLNIRSLGALLGRDALLEDLTEENIAALLAFVRKKERSPATCNKIRAQLVALWNLAARKKLLPTFPEVGRLKEFERVPIAWMPDQLDRLFAACREERGRIAEIPAGDWWEALHYVLYDCGTRATATLKLRWEDVDLNAGSVLFRAENQKDRGDQVFILQPDTVDALRKIKRVDGPVFPWPHHKQTLYNRYHRIRLRAGLPVGRKRCFHCMRKSFASYLEAKSPGAATEALGHSNRSITKLYLDPRIVGAAKPSQYLPRPKRDYPPC